jgi:hypothetical protein
MKREKKLAKPEGNEKKCTPLQVKTKERFRVAQEVGGKKEYV